jgi:hypothetical protein
LLPVISPLIEKLGELAQKFLPILVDAFENQFLPILQDVISFIRGLFTELDKGLSIWDATVEAVLNWTQVGEDNFLMILNVVQAIEAFVAKVKEAIQPVVDAITNFVTMKDVLIALGIVIGVTLISAVVSLIAAMLPIIATIAAIVAAVAFVRKVWEEDFLGIKSALIDFWENKGKPIFETVKAWLEVNIPKAIEILTDWWKNTLLPAIRDVWEFIQNDLMPLFAALWELISVAGKLALQAISGFWENVLKPALQDLWAFLQERLIPVWESFQFMMSKVSDSVGGVSGAIQGVIGWIGDLIDKLSNIKLPDWLVPGSPTPFEIGLRGISAALQDVNRQTGMFNSGLSIGVGGPSFAGAGNTNTTNLNLALHTPQSSGSVIQDFNMMRAVLNG